MPEVLKIDEPTVTTSYIVWVAKTDGDDWGRLPDDSYSHERFRPNRVCVVVRQGRGQTWADWTQARFHWPDLGKSPDMEDCRGTYEFEDDYYAEYTYFAGTCTCLHEMDEHGWGECGVEAHGRGPDWEDDCQCEAGWEE